MPFGSSTSSMVVPSLAKAIIALVKTAVQAMSGQGHLREGMKRPLFISPPSVGCAARAAPVRRAERPRCTRHNLATEDTSVEILRLRTEMKKTGY